MKPYFFFLSKKNFLATLSILTVTLFFTSCSSTKSVRSHSSNTRIKNKYAKKLNVPNSYITNIKLYKFIDNWMGTPYKYGGIGKKGVDCSGFVKNLYSSVYNKESPRTTKKISKSIKRVSKSRLKEGNIVFFNTIKKKKNSHIGVYLKNNMFVHASSSSGVTISSLDNPYYKKKYSKGGRLK